MGHSITINMIVLDPVNMTQKYATESGVLNRNACRMLDEYRVIAMTNEGSSFFPLKILALEDATHVGKIKPLTMPGTHGTGTKCQSTRVGQACLEMIRFSMAKWTTGFTKPVLNNDQFTRPNPSHPGLRLRPFSNRSCPHPPTDRIPSLRGAGANNQTDRKHAMRPWIAACTAAAFAAGCGSATVRPPDLAITGVDVVDVEAGTVLPGRTVTIVAGRITGVHERADAAEGAARVLEGAGRWLIPGLWDMHVHIRGGVELAEANRRLLPVYVGHGVTTVRDAGGDLADSVLVWRGRIAAGELVGPRILTAGPKLDGPTGGWDGSIRIATPAGVSAAFDSLQALGVDYVKLYDGSMSGAVFLAAVDEARRRGLIVTGHMPFSVDFRDAVAHGLNASEHLYPVVKGTAANEDSVTRAVGGAADAGWPLGLWNALARIRPRYDDARAKETYRIMAEAGTAVLPTLHIMRTLSWLAETDHTRDPELRYIDPAFEATYEGRIRSARQSSPTARRERQLLNELFVRMVPDLHAAGVTIMAGSDAGASNSYVYPGASLHAELRELVGAGLSPADALRAATIHSARFMGRGEEYGSVAAGRRADLVLLTANPLDDIANTRAIDAVIFGGEVLDRAALDRLFEGAAAR